MIAFKKLKGNHFDFLKPLFIIAAPIILQNFLTSFVNMLDTIMVGQLGSVDIAAVGLGNQVFFVMNIVLFGTVSGGSIFMSQYWGKKDMAGIYRTMGILIALSLCISLLFFCGAFFAPEFCMGLYTRDPEVIDRGSRYLKAVSFSYLFFGIGFAFAQAERSTEHVVLPTVATFISAGINALLNFVLIFGIEISGRRIIPAYGVVGAAVATVVARLAESLILLIIPYVRRFEVAVHPRKFFTVTGDFIKRYAKICLPVLINESLWGTGISLQSVLFAHCGTAEIAAFNITTTISNLLWPFFIGCGNGLAIIIGKKIGEGEYAVAKRLAKQISFFCSGCGLVMALILIPLTHLLPYLFKVEPVVIHMAAVLLTMKACLYWSDAFNMCSVVGVCRSGGDTLFGLIMDVGFMWLLSLPLGFVAVGIFHAPYWAVYACVLSDSVLKFFLGVYRVTSGKWLRDIT